MDDKTYRDRADAALSRVEAMFRDVDTNDADYDRAGDVITFTFRDGTRCVLNTQRPARQLWLAARARAWHFSFDDTSASWRDDKDAGVELFNKLAELAQEAAGIVLAPG